MNRMILATVFATVAITCSIARADVVYNYVGNALLPQTASPPDSAIDSLPITISLDFSNDGSTLLHWSATQPRVGTIDVANVASGGGLTPEIYLDTDASGNVISWYFSVYTPSPGQTQGSGAYRQSLSSYSDMVLGQPLLPYVPQAWDEGVDIEGADRSFVYVGLNQNDPGAWVSAGGTLANLTYVLPTPPSPPPVPEPSQAATLLVGLLAVGFGMRLGNGRARL